MLFVYHLRRETGWSKFVQTGREKQNPEWKFWQNLLETSGTELRSHSFGAGPGTGRKNLRFFFRKFQLKVSENVER